MKLIGRILLLVTSLCLIAFSVVTIKNNVNMIGNDWTNISSYPEKMSCLIAIICQIGNLIFGLTGIIACLKGKSTFLLKVFSLIILVNVVYSIISVYKGKSSLDIKDISKISVQFLLPICYFIGSIFIRM